MEVIDLLYDNMFCRPSIHLVVVEEEEQDTPHHSSGYQGEDVADRQVPIVDEITS